MRHRGGRARRAGATARRTIRICRMENGQGPPRLSCRGRQDLLLSAAPADRSSGGRPAYLSGRRDLPGSPACRQPCASFPARRPCYGERAHAQGPSALRQYDADSLDQDGGADWRLRRHAGRAIDARAPASRTGLSFRHGHHRSGATLRAQSAGSSLREGARHQRDQLLLRERHPQVRARPREPCHRTRQSHALPRQHGAYYHRKSSHAPAADLAPWEANRPRNIRELARCGRSRRCMLARSAAETGRGR
ncbi:hypothetical protein ACVIYL_008945 [Bradyrhizobium sp. USDA 3315]